MEQGSDDENDSCTLISSVWQIQIVMKRMQRQNSPDALGKTSTTNLHAYRIQPLSKSFRKKHHPAEPSTISSASNLAKTFSKTRIKPVVPQHESPIRPSQRRSHSRGHSKPIERVSLASYAYHHQHGMSTTGKLLRISGIFSKCAGGGVVDSLKQLYQQNDELLEQLFQWQKTEVYDEVDRLVYQLTQLFIRKIETVLQQTHSDMETRLAAYEATVSRLQQQNRLLKAEKQKDRLEEEYHKNQWGNAILQQVRKLGVNLDDFVRKMPLYRQVAIGQDYAEQQIERYGIGISATQQIVCRSEGNIKKGLI